jgi:hypothetical protein
MGVSSLVVIYVRFGGPSAHFQYLSINDQHFEATNIKKEIALRNTLNAKAETLCSQNELCQA